MPRNTFLVCMSLVQYVFMNWTTHALTLIPLLQSNFTCTLLAKKQWHRTLQLQTCAVLCWQCQKCYLVTIVLLLCIAAPVNQIASRGFNIHAIPFLLPFTQVNFFTTHLYKKTKSAQKYKNFSEWQIWPCATTKATFLRWWYVRSHYKNICCYNKYCYNRFLPRQQWWVPKGNKNFCSYNKKFRKVCTTSRWPSEPVMS